MKIQNARITFVSFDAQDVITTSAAPKLYASGSALYDIYKSVPSQDREPFKSSRQYEAYCNGSSPSSFVSWYLIGKDYSISYFSPQKTYTLNLTASVSSTNPVAGDKQITVGGQTGLDQLIDWLVTYGTDITPQ